MSWDRFAGRATMPPVMLLVDGYGGSDSIVWLVSACQGLRPMTYPQFGSASLRGRHGVVPKRQQVHAQSRPALPPVLQRGHEVWLQPLSCHRVMTPFA